MATDANASSGLLGYLPGVFQEGRQGKEPTFVGRFLLGFEKLLLGLGDPAEPGLEEVIAKLYRYFEPGENLPEGERVPAELLPWLAGWLALTLREDWDDQRKRNLIANASRLYRLRGTAKGMTEFVSIYTVLGVTIEELNTPFQIGVHSTIGLDSYLSGGGPFFFRVRVLLPTADPAELKRQTEAARAIVEMQKPAHTFYELVVDTPRFQIGVHSTLGVDTLLTD
ncbi:MAG TPA: phage tail protein I [Myxococcales bacterium]|nr:phage tail protein I [Myxococcales bacterium]